MTFKDPFQLTRFCDCPCALLWTCSHSSASLLRRGPPPWTQYCGWGLMKGEQSRARQSRGDRHLHLPAAPPADSPRCCWLSGPQELTSVRVEPQTTRLLCPLSAQPVQLCGFALPQPQHCTQLAHAGSHAKAQPHIAMTASPLSGRPRLHQAPPTAQTPPTPKLRPAPAVRPHPVTPTRKPRPPRVVTPIFPPPRSPASSGPGGGAPRRVTSGGPGRARAGSSRRRRRAPSGPVPSRRSPTPVPRAPPP